MKALLLCILAAVPLFGRAADDPRIYIHLLREHDELLCGTAQRHAQESATIVYPRDGDSVIVVIKPLRRAENALVGIRFYRELSEVQSPAEGLDYIAVSWDTPTKVTFGGVDYILTASLKGWPQPGKRPNHTSRPTPSEGRRG